jgi:two-component system sensor histidine kinase EvgS
MITSRLLKRAAILLMGLLPWAAMALEEPHVLRLLGHSTLANPSVVLDEADWRWLRERRTLSMGLRAL